ncbi:HD domain-containing protein [Tunicatimonas pelagia]|uniref:HD domain-containing protein n=1 Tax=Tunicatimonas pelagia TaxID=931531 RepID=UPI00266667C0|nr:HD domain-containing protein [Tunicatimonas pelagia]WKN42432.1 HD domain-containing protein [Tunicatimonas pelagia]
MADLSPQTLTDQIFTLYKRYGNDAYGESVTQTEHMVQSAHLAKQEGFGDEVILAAFFHDIGHFLEHEPAERMGELGAQQHDRLGGDFLRKRGFSERMARLIEGHVAAKRYLTFCNPNYYETLSEASKQTLQYQGGAMAADEAQAFEQDELFDLMIKMRHWDDEAKVPNRPIKNLDRYREMCLNYLCQRVDH